MISIVRTASVFVALYLVGTAVANADIIVNRTPVSSNIPLGQTTSVTVTWLITPTTCGGTGTVSSPVGFLQIGANQINIGGALSKPIAFPGPSVQITETVIVPPSASTQAIQANLGTITYNRTFTTSISCTSTTDSNSVAMPITSPAAASFGVSRLALSFDNGAPMRVLERKKPLQANAEVNFNGNGMLQGQWEVASPASTAGEAAFRSIGAVRQYMVGSNTQTVASPALPTDAGGLYLVRLRVTEPSPNFEMPVIRYFVTDAQSAGRVASAPIAPMSPANQALLTRETMFAWEPANGVKIYQLEIYAKPRVAGDTIPAPPTGIGTAPLVLPTTPPVTGMLIGETQTRTTLSDTARARLLSGENYLWRVIAFGAGGAIVGESALREFRMP